MSLDQGHRQLADFADQGLETLGFLHPFSDLLEKILGHVNGACLATVPEGDVVGLVQRATVMAAQDGWPQRLFTCMRLAARMGPEGTSCSSRRSNIRRTSVGWLGTRMDGPLGLPVSRRYTGKGSKNQPCEEKKEHPPRPIASTEVLLWTCAAVKVRGISPFLRAVLFP